MAELEQRIGSVYRFVGVKYSYENGPHIVQNEYHAVEDGLNCQTFFHFFYQDMFGIALDPAMRSKETYEDQDQFRNVEREEELKFGDIFFFGSKKSDKLSPPDSRFFHIAVYIGGDRLIHANKKDGKVVIASFQDFFDQRRYKNTYTSIQGVKRFREELIR